MLLHYLVKAENPKIVTDFGSILQRPLTCSRGYFEEHLTVDCIENCLTNQLVKEFLKLVHICQSYYQTSSGLIFSETRCTSTLKENSCRQICLLVNLQKKMSRCVITTEWVRTEMIRRAVPSYLYFTLMNRSLGNLHSVPSFSTLIFHDFSVAKNCTNP